MPALAKVRLPKSSARASDPRSVDPHVELMLQTKAGDQSAFASLARAYERRLFRLFFDIVRDHHAAEDLVQETLLRAYRARHNYRPSARFVTWLYTIAGNVGRNALRSRRRSRVVSCVDLEPSTNGENQLVDPDALKPIQVVLRRELHEKVRAALETLTDCQRVATMMQRFDGCSYRDIAHQIGVTPHVVKSMLRKSRGRLRVALTSYVQPGA